MESPPNFLAQKNSGSTVQSSLLLFLQATAGSRFVLLALADWPIQHVCFCMRFQRATATETVLLDRRAHYSLKAICIVTSVVGIEPVPMIHYRFQSGAF